MASWLTAATAWLGVTKAEPAVAASPPAAPPSPARPRPRTAELAPRVGGDTGPLLPPPVRPVVNLGGSQSVIFDIERQALRALNDAGLGPHAEELTRRLKRPDLSRYEFLKIVQEYVEVT